jgi:hypothetical protein
MIPRRIKKTDCVNHVANEVKTFPNPIKKTVWGSRLRVLEGLWPPEV